MKCPYRVGEVRLFNDGKTCIYQEFAECYGKQCPYFDEYHKSNCRKVTAEIRDYASQEVE